MRRRGSALVEFGLVVGALLALVTSVGAFAPAIATKSKVVDATLAAALEASTYRVPDEQVDRGQEEILLRANQYAQLCRNSALVAYQMLAAGGLNVGPTAPTICKDSDAAAKDRLWVTIPAETFTLGTDAVPKSPFQLCVNYRYAIEGGIVYLAANGLDAVDTVTLPSIPIAACTAVYLDDDRSESRP